MAEPASGGGPEQNAARQTRLRFESVGNLARLAVGIALLVVLYYLHIIDIAMLRALLQRPEVLALALATALAGLPLEALRWHILLKSQGVHARYAETAKVFVTSVFFANFLPGAAGGDLIRAVYLYRNAAGKRVPALLSIAIDRLIGFTAFVILGLAAMLLRPGTIPDALQLIVIAASLLFLAALGLLFAFGHRIAELLEWLLRRHSTRLAHAIDQTGQALRAYARDWRSMSLALLLSVVIVILSVAPIVLLAEAMQPGALSTLDYGIAGLYALIANSLPLTPGGLGIGEGAFAEAATVLAPHVSHAAFGTIFLAYRCVFILSTVPGLAWYLIAA